MPWLFHGISNQQMIHPSNHIHVSPEANQPTDEHFLFEDNFVFCIVFTLMFVSDSLIAPNDLTPVHIAVIMAGHPMNINKFHN